MIPNPEHLSSKERFVIHGISKKTNLLTVCHCYIENEEVIVKKSSKKALTKVINEIPDGVDILQKYFVGIYNNDDIVAILDLITGYLNLDDVLIDWYMAKE